MERITLSPEQQSYLDSERTNAGAAVGDPVVSGTTLVVDSHLEVDHAWRCVVVGGASGDAPVVYVPEWGDFVFPCDLLPYVTDHAGPNGEGMPIYDQQQMLARASSGNPQQAATDERTERREGLKRALQDSLKRIDDPHARKLARDAMQRAGAL